MNVISITKLSKYYGQRVGVFELTLDVSAGQVFGFLGPNGAGKTTSIRILLGLLRPSSGGAQILGLDCWSASPRLMADVGYIPGDLRLYPWLNLHRAMRIAGQVRGHDLTSEGQQLARMLELEADLPVRSMSRGNRQKLGLILALAHRPKLLVLDEPTTGLDPIMQERLKQHLKSLAADGHTVFFSSHSLGEVQHLCDRVAILRQGELVTSQSLASLRAQAIRQVTITWRDQPPPVPSSDLLTVDQPAAMVWHCTLNGKVPDLLGYLAGQPVADLAIGQPDLDTLFQHYYREGAIKP